MNGLSALIKRPQEGKGISRGENRRKGLIVW